MKQDATLKDHNRVIVPIFRDMSALGMKPRFFILDSVEKPKVMELVAHNGYYSCSICLIEGEQCDKCNTENNAKTKKKKIKKVIFPLPPGPDPPPRELEEHKHLCANLAAARQTNIGKRGKNRVHVKNFGVKKLAPVFKFPNFNPFHNVHVDLMHAAFLGHIKRFLEATLHLSGDKKEIYHLKERFLPDQLNTLLIKTAVFSELRRTRSIDLSKWKATEYKAVALFFFPLLIHFFEVAHRDHISEYIGLLCYALRWVYLSKEFRREQEHSMTPTLFKRILRLIQLLTKDVLGNVNCTYNSHTLFHLDHILQHCDSATDVSAFSAEGSYSQLTANASLCTTSFVKVGMRNIYRKAIIDHRCAITFRLSTRQTGKVNDRLVYASVNGVKDFYELQPTPVGVELRDNQYYAFPIISCPLPDFKSHQDEDWGFTLEWKHVGCWKFLSVDKNRPIVINRNMIEGKAILLPNQWLMLATTNILKETVNT